MTNQKRMDDLIIRIYRHKLNKFKKVLTKGEIFDFVKYWFYSVAWEKRTSSYPHVDLE